MKNFIIICFTLFCLNFNLKPNDYRDAFCGTYNCKRVYKHLNVQRNGVVYDTSNAVLNISKNALDSVLTLTTPENNFNLKLKNGKLQSIDKNLHNHGYFSNDTLCFVFIPSLGPDAIKYIGKK